MGQLKEPVHENLTDLSIRCANTPLKVENNVIAACAGRPQLVRAAFDLTASEQDLIRASRWSDAPPMRTGSFINPSRLVCGEVRVPENAACWAMLMSTNSAIPFDEATAQVPDAERARVRHTLQNLLRRSHYGDMQFLHAMASPGEAPARTRERMLHWAAFSYQVANGGIAVDALISSLDSAWHSNILRGLGDRTVHQLFETRSVAGAETVRRLALGALLHMVQDSFSASHTGREPTAGDTAPFGAITMFHDYGCQSPSQHAESDRAEAAPWLTAATRPARDPVTLGAQLIAWSRAGVAWEPQVRDYLETVAFPLAPSLQAVAYVTGQRCATLK